MSYRRIPNETRAKAMADYLLGEKVEVICAEHGIDPTTLQRMRRRENIPPRSVGRFDPDNHVKRDWLICSTKK
jgi:transposase-like protein